MQQCADKKLEILEIARTAGILMLLPGKIHGTQLMIFMEASSSPKNKRNVLGATGIASTYIALIMLRNTNVVKVCATTSTTHVVP